MIHTGVQGSSDMLKVMELLSERAETRTQAA